MTTPVPYVEINGHRATEEDLRIPAFSPYGHFTAMQVRDRKVRGLALHLERLDSANRELFGLPLDGEQVRELIRHALDGAGVRDASLRLYAFRPPGSVGTTPMVTVRKPWVPVPAPMSLMSVPYARAAPHIKRPGEFSQLYYRAQAERAGYDEALLTAPGGVVTEGAITNIGFWDGTSVVWPDGPALRGITMALLEAALPSVRRAVTLEDLGGYESAFLTNSRGINPVHRIDDVHFPVNEPLMTRLTTTYESTPWDAV
ncbi:MAG TPA: aminotransferase class IV family protein [Streptomyces sp.]